MQLSRDGAQHFPAALGDEELAQLESALSSVPADAAGVRLHGIGELTPLLAAAGPIGRIAAQFLGPGAQPVRALLFNKTEARNWALGWHQDRTIAVRDCVDAPGFTHWTVKAGMHHVEPPFEILERMLTLRVHLDPVGPGNAPLLIVLSSHRLGRIPEPESPHAVERLGACACLAERGDIWIYSTPILHASEAAAEPTERRVLQVDYSAEDLPAPAAWLGV